MSMVKKTLRASAVQEVGTEYFPASTGFDLSVVDDERVEAATIFVNYPGDASGTLDLTVELSDDAGTTWFTPEETELGVFAQMTTVAAKKYLKLPALADRFRLKAVVGTAQVDAWSATFLYKGKPGAYSA